MKLVCSALALFYICHCHALVPINPECAVIHLPYEANCQNVCEIENYSISGCTASDYKCLCLSSTYVTASHNCILSQCSTLDYNAAHEYTIYVCSLYGVSPEIGRAHV